MVEKAAIELKSQSRQFDDVHNHALQFARAANAYIIQRTEAILEVKAETYDNLYHIYKLICTISVTQVVCERSFSKLKLIKTRLRNSMSNDHSESYMLISVEKNLLDSLECDTIIQRYGSSSSELSKLLKE